LSRTTGFGCANVGGAFPIPTRLARRTAHTEAIFHAAGGAIFDATVGARFTGLPEARIRFASADTALLTLRTARGVTVEAQPVVAGRSGCANNTCTAIHTNAGVVAVLTPGAVDANAGTANTEVVLIADAICGTGELGVLALRYAFALNAGEVGRAFSHIVRDAVAVVVLAVAKFDLRSASLAANPTPVVICVATANESTGDAFADDRCARRQITRNTL